jgi:hypothetical protein
VAVSDLISAGNMFQINQAAKQFSTVTGLFTDQGWIFQLIVAVLWVRIVIISGLKYCEENRKSSFPSCATSM